MKTLVDQLANYAAYHRDRRNVATHFIGIPMIVLGVAVLAARPTATWLSVGGELFAVGWVVQFVGHAWEGRKPAFVDDLVGRVIGPLLVAAELGFLLGLRNEVRQAVEARASPFGGPAEHPTPGEPRWSISRR